MTPYDKKKNLIFIEALKSTLQMSDNFREYINIEEFNVEANHSPYLCPEIQNTCPLKALLIKNENSSTSYSTVTNPMLS